MQCFQALDQISLKPEPPPSRKLKRRTIYRYYTSVVLSVVVHIERNALAGERAGDLFLNISKSCRGQLPYSPINQIILWPGRSHIRQHFIIELGTNSIVG